MENFFWRKTVFSSFSAPAHCVRDLFHEIVQWTVKKNVVTISSLLMLCCTTHGLACISAHSLKRNWPRGTYHCNRPYHNRSAFLRVYFVSSDCTLYQAITGYKILNCSNRKDLCETGVRKCMCYCVLDLMLNISLAELFIRDSYNQQRA